MDDTDVFPAITEGAQCLRGAIMKYFVDEQTRAASHSSCYFEFQRGRYAGAHWKSDSICLNGDLWNELRLSELFAAAIPGFAYCGVTRVTPRDWARLEALSQSHPAWRKVVEEARPWVERCFAAEGEFSLLGM